MFSERVETYRKQFVHGKFSLLLSDELKAIIRSNGVPNKPGAYVISSFISGTEKILDIAMAGTMHKDGKFGDQKLAGRLQAQQRWNGVKYNRAEFYKMQMRELKAQKLDFEWFVTFDETNEVLPAYAEAELMQAFFFDNRRLPDWNLEF